MVSHYLEEWEYTRPFMSQPPAFLPNLVFKSLLPTPYAEPKIFQRVFQGLPVQDSLQKKDPMVKYCLQITAKYLSFLGDIELV